MTLIYYALIYLIGDVLETIGDVAGSSSLDDMINHPDFIKFIIYLTVILISVSSALLSFILYRVMRPIALFIIGRNAGYPRPWIVLIPYGCHFMEFALPMREFNILNWIKTDKRETIAWTYIALDFFKPIISFILSMLPLIGNLSGIIITGTFALFKWRKYYDLLRTYGFKNSAMTLSVLSLFCKPLYCVLLFLMCDKTPDFGWKGFENPIMISYDGEIVE